MSVPRLLVRRLVGYIRRAPGTYIWLAILLATTIVQRSVPPASLDRILTHRSTNLHHLAHEPLVVLFTSALWLDGAYFGIYFVVFNVFSVPAERWLGTGRWLAVVIAGHVGATLISQGVLWIAIQLGDAAYRRTFAIDVGVSYALVALAAALSYRMPAPWRYMYAVVLLGLLSVPLWTAVTFTEIGHFTAALIGLLCYPITRVPRIAGSAAFGGAGKGSR